MNGSPFRVEGEDVILAVRVTPRAKRSTVAGTIVGADGQMALEVRLSAPPVDGAANQALIAFLAAELEVPKSAVKIVAGERSRLKRVAIGPVASARVEQWVRRRCA